MHFARLLPTCALLILSCAADDPRAIAVPVSRILLVTLDTTRADRIGAYGHTAAHTPILDGLASRGVLFERAFAPTPITLPSHASILTGTWPTEHGVRDNGLFRLAAEATLLPEVLQRHGWRTGAFVAAYVLDASFGLDQGFEVYRSPPKAEIGATSLAEWGAGEVVSEARRWLGSVEQTESWVDCRRP